MNGFCSALFVLLPPNITNFVAMRKQYLQSCSELSLFNPNNALMKNNLLFLSRVHPVEMRPASMRMVCPKAIKSCTALVHTLANQYPYHTSPRQSRWPQHGPSGCLISSETSYIAPGWSSLTRQCGSSRFDYRLAFLTDFSSLMGSIPVVRAEVGMCIPQTQYIQGK